MSEQPSPLTFDGDRLGRQKFADTLCACAVALAADSALASGRVIAVNARWGSGKSWVADRLESHFANAKGIGRCVKVNTLQFDFHHDPFSVISSAILSGATPGSKVTRDFKKSAKDVLRASLPAVAKGVAKVGLRSLGIDPQAASDATDEIASSGLDLSERAFEAMLKSFDETRKSTAAFKDKLAKLAADSGGALIVIVDELDRCRPSFALETLERIKHLFDVPNVVFILFMHDAAMHAAITHTYGDGIDPQEYLRKFVTVTADLPSVLDDQADAEIRFVNEFLREHVAGSQAGTQQDRSARDFLLGVGQLAPCFKATLRDVEQTVLLWRLTRGGRRVESEAFALAALVRVTDGQLFGRLMRSEPQAYKQLANRLLNGRGPGEVPNLVAHFWAALMYCVEPLQYVADSSSLSEEDRLVLQYLQGDPGRNGGHVQHHLALALGQLKLVGMRV